MMSPRPRLRVVGDFGTSHKVAESLDLLFKEVVGSRVIVGAPNGTVIDETKPNNRIGHVPELDFATALAGTGAYFRSIRISTAVGCLPPYQSGNDNVGDGARRNGVLEGTKPMRRAVSARNYLAVPAVTHRMCQ